MRRAVHVYRTENAEADLDAIAAYYGTINPAATLAILDAVARTQGLLAEHPFVGRPGKVPGTREAVVVGTAFILVYVPSADAVTIVKVLDSRSQWPAANDDLGQWLVREAPQDRYALRTAAGL